MWPWGTCVSSPDVVWDHGCVPSRLWLQMSGGRYVYCGLNVHPDMKYHFENEPTPWESWRWLYHWRYLSAKNTLMVFACCAQMWMAKAECRDLQHIHVMSQYSWWTECLPQQCQLSFLASGCGWTVSHLVMWSQLRRSIIVPNQWQKYSKMISCLESNRRPDQISIFVIDDPLVIKRAFAGCFVGIPCQRTRNGECHLRSP